MIDQRDKKSSSPKRESKEPGSANVGNDAGPEGRTGSQERATARRAGGADVHAYIGRQLRAVYDDVAKQPVPDRFLDLIRQLETKTGNR